MDLQMITPVAFDWDKDGDLDLICGDEDGRVAFLENVTPAASGKKRIDGAAPQFMPPRYFQQEAADLKCGALSTPACYDWDGDGDQDIISGNTAGYIAFFENLGPVTSKKPKASAPPAGIRWAAPVNLKAGGETIRIQAGTNGSIQGPCEAKWGYTTNSVADWDHDGLPDIVANSIWGKVVWYRNTGTRRRPALAAAAAVEVEWKRTPPKPAWNWWSPAPRELATQWRTTPVVFDWDSDGLNDLVMVDHQGFLALFKRTQKNGDLLLQPGARIFADAEKGTPLRLNPGIAGRSGRRKLCIADWNGDGRPDLLTNTVNANVLMNKQKNTFADTGPVSPQKLAGHTTSPATCDFNGDGVPDILIGAEDGYFYYMQNPRKAK